VSRLRRLLVASGLALALSLAYWLVLLLYVTSDAGFKPFRYMGF